MRMKFSKEITVIGIFLSILQLVKTEDGAPDKAIEIRDICKTCFCDPGIKPFLIDCSKKNLIETFNDDDWFETLKQNNIGTATEGTVDLDVRFDDNQITEIKQFPPLPIKKLSFTNNKINKISDSAFQNLDRLFALDLSQNLLTARNLPEQVFYGQLNESSYKPLSIQHLNLSSNDIKSLDKDLLDHFPDLFSLDLSNNPLTVLGGSTAISIAELSNLQYLNLANTKISKIPEAMLHQLPSLISLDLSRNEFSKMPDEIRNTHSLEVLSLDNNKFESFDNTSFLGLESLKELYISHMKTLRLIEKGAFGPLKNLTKLYCNYNSKLDRIHNAAFYEISATSDDWPIMELYLNDNALTHLDEALAAWTMIRYIDIQNNPFRCDCDLQWMSEELMTEIQRMHPQLTRNVRCNEPKELRGTYILELGMEPESFKRCNSGVRSLNGKYASDEKYDFHQAAATTVLVIGVMLIVIGLSILGVLIVKRRAIAQALIHHQQIRYQRAEDDDIERDVYKASGSFSRF